jgi:RHS repeat-associated protein
MFYDGANPVQELSGSTVTANLLTGLGVDERFTRTDSSATANFLTDALGSTLALTDGGVSTLASYTYEPFGNATMSGGSTSTYQYTGRENDGTGVYFNRARYYSLTLQRFVSEDPIGLSGGIDLYEYVDSNPISLVDPFGLSTLTFDRASGTLTLFPGNTQGYPDESGEGGQPVTFPAGNNTINPNGDPNTMNSNGPAPNGVYPIQQPVPTGNSPSYGPYFFPIGAPGSFIRRRGIGLHGGRRGPQSRTEGCIRVSNDTMRQLEEYNQTDPILEITIQ